MREREGGRREGEGGEREEKLQIKWVQNDNEDYSSAEFFDEVLNSLLPSSLASYYNCASQHCRDEH